MPDDESNYWGRWTNRPHVVILGAGASRAATLVGDTRGRMLPLMADFVDVVPKVKDHLDQARGSGIQVDAQDFEGTFRRIADCSALSDLRGQLEQDIRSYFESIQLPPILTIYDYLLHGLRKKDVIATLNWDPLLLQVVRRRSSIVGDELPDLLFLHGNVEGGFCVKHKIHGHKGYLGSCGDEFEPYLLLYPVDRKNYLGHPATKSFHDRLRGKLRNAFMLTIFGWSVSVADDALVKTIRDAWGSSEKRNLEQIEVIDIRKDKAIDTAWDSLYKHIIHTHHYDVRSSFYDSWVAKHPRRTGEAFLCRFFPESAEQAFVNDENDRNWRYNTSASEVEKCIEPLIEEEREEAIAEG